MKKEDLVLGNAYEVIYGTNYVTGSKYHEYPVGEVVTCIYLKGGGYGDPEFKNEAGKTQFLKLEQIKPVVPVKPVVKVGDKVRIINEGNNSSNGTYYRVGHEGVVTKVGTNTINVDLTAYGLPLNKPAVDFGDFEVINVDPVAELKTAYDNAKTAYETAVREQKEAEQKAKEALKFTEDDIKNFMVVEFIPTDLRLVVINGNRVNFLNNTGVSNNECSRASLLGDLNTYYKKTTKTLKDFANA